MPDEINLRLPREFANELLHNLDGVIERWEATEELLRRDYCRDDVLGKYDVSRQLEAAPSTLKQAPLLEAA